MTTADGQVLRVSGLGESDTVEQNAASEGKRAVESSRAESAAKAKLQPRVSQFSFV